MKKEFIITNGNRMTDHNEIDNIRSRYEKRKESDSRYNPLLPSVYMPDREKEIKLIRLFTKNGFVNLNDKKLLEIGGGGGQNILMLLRLGFQPDNIYFNELLEDRFEDAKNRLPQGISFHYGNALDLNFQPESFDFILQSMVFTSILDNNMKSNLAHKIWQWLKPGGSVIWYDFIYDNPRNKDVKGISLKALKKYFPEAKIQFNSLTLAPPLSRMVTKIHPGLYNFFNFFPFLRTHILCLIEK